MRIFFAYSLLGAALLAPGFTSAADWAITVDGNGFARGQAADPSQPETTVRLKQHILLDESGRLRSDTVSTFPGDIRFHFRDIGDNQGIKTVDIAGWRAGTELVARGAQESRVTYADLLLYSPEILLKVSAGKSAVDEKGVQTLVDPAGRSLQLQRNIGGDIAEIREGSQRYIYSDWSSLGALRQPGRVKLERGDRVLREVAVTLKTATLTDDDLQIPAGYDQAFPRKGLRIEQVTGDLYRLEGSPSTYHMAFAVSSDGIVLFDTPRSKEEGEAMRRVIAEKFPGRTVTDIVYSHGHIDHQAGLSAWLDMNPQIWTGVGGEIALKRNVPEAGKARVQELSQASDLVRGNLRFRLLPVRSEHAYDMLVVLFPAAQAVLQGDLFMVPNQGPAAAYSTAEQLQQLLREEKFAAKHIISVHGRVATPEELETSVRLQKARGKTTPQ